MGVSRLSLVKETLRKQGLGLRLMEYFPGDRALVVMYL